MADEPELAIVATIHDHFSRKATPEVWEEVDSLRKRVAELEAENSALLAALTRAGANNDPSK